MIHLARHLFRRPAHAFRRVLAATAAGLALALPLPALAQTDVDLWITIFSTPGEPDRIAVAYNRAPASAQIRADFATLARHLGAPTPSLTIEREKDVTGELVTTAEAKLPGLANAETGQANLDPLIQTFGRFGHFRTTCFFFGNFSPAPVQNITRGPVRVEAEVRGHTVDYRIWVDQARRGSGPLPSVAAPAGAPSTALPAWKPLVGVLALTLLVALGAFLIARIVLTQRRASSAREVNP